MDAIDSSSISIPQRSSRKKIIGIIGLGIAAVLCLCVATTVVNFTRVTANQGEVEAVFKDFMMAMKNKDSQAATALMSSRAKRAANVPEQISTLLTGNNYALFDGFKDISVSSFNVTTAINSDPDMPQGTVVTIQGSVLYEGGITGTFAVTLEEEDSAWKIYNLHVTVPPNKIK